MRNLKIPAVKRLIVIAVVFLNLSATAQYIKFKYLALNVPNKMAAAQWYKNTLGFKIITNNKDVYVSDAGNNFRIKFLADPTQKSNYKDVSFDACHIALESDSMHYWSQRILKAGGSYNTPPRLNAIGDAVIDMRDPNGFMIQLIYRVHPYYTHTPGSLRFEHLALNMSNNKDAALWYVEFMGLTIPWSKDPADSTRAVSNYRIPYVGDPGHNMAMEFLTTGDTRPYTQLGFGVSYIAFEVSNARKLAKNMIRGGAKQVGDIQKNSNGDIAICMRCPWGNMIQLIQTKAS